MPDPLISCVMATGGRRDFLERAIRLFLRQSHPAKEMVVVDDDPPSLGRPGPDDPRIRYVNVHGQGMPLCGQKMNAGIMLAQGEILQKMDDDDWYHPDFLSVMVRNYSGPDAIHGLTRYHVLVRGLGRIIRTGNDDWPSGATLMFSRDLSMTTPFRAVEVGTDSIFVRDCLGVRRVAIMDQSHLLMVVRHGRNTWKWGGLGRTVDEDYASFIYRTAPLPGGMDPKDEAFYKDLMSGPLPEPPQGPPPTDPNGITPVARAVDHGALHVSFVAFEQEDSRFVHGLSLSGQSFRLYDETASGIRTALPRTRLMTRTAPDCLWRLVPRILLDFWETGAERFALVVGAADLGEFRAESEAWRPEQPARISSSDGKSGWILLGVRDLEGHMTAIPCRPPEGTGRLSAVFGIIGGGLA